MASARLRQRRSGGREELPRAPSQEQWPRGATPPRGSGAPPKRSYPTPGVRGPAQEELPRAQEGREELLHVQGQEGLP